MICAVGPCLQSNFNKAGDLSQLAIQPATIHSEFGVGETFEGGAQDIDYFDVFVPVVKIICIISVRGN